MNLTVTNHQKTINSRRIIEYYCFIYSTSLEKGEIIWQDLERFLKKYAESNIFIYPGDDIDSMWHCFILHTESYYNYCISTYGKIIHHYPHINSFGCGNSGEAECS